MPIRESVSLKEVEADTSFAEAKAVRLAAFRVAAFEHDGSDASDMLWDVLCEEARDAIRAWEKACGGRP